MGPVVVVHFKVFTHMLQEYIVSSSSLKKIPKLFYAHSHNGGVTKK